MIFLKCMFKISGHGNKRSLYHFPQLSNRNSVLHRVRGLRHHITKHEGHSRSQDHRGVEEIIWKGSQSWPQMQIKTNTSKHFYQSTELRSCDHRLAFPGTGSGGEGGYKRKSGCSVLHPRNFKQGDKAEPWWGHISAQHYFKKKSA